MPALESIRGHQFHVWKFARLYTPAHVILCEEVVRGGNPACTYVRGCRFCVGSYVQSAGGATSTVEFDVAAVRRYFGVQWCHRILARF